MSAFLGIGGVETDGEVVGVRIFGQAEDSWDDADGADGDAGGG